MKILAIETSCDETAIAVVEAHGNEQSASFTVLGNALLSQVELHAEYGGVYPNLAKREHAKNLAPLLTAALEEAEMIKEDVQELPDEQHDAIAKLLEREPGLGEATLAFLKETEAPAIDAIAVTAGPGLEPALWVGVNFAKALALAWGKPIVAVNHLEGHILAGIATADETQKILTTAAPSLPLLGLGIAGGHTDMILMEEWLRYTTIGQTVDDSVGEAFDKVARMLNLPYPGGPQVSKLAEAARAAGKENPFTLPRPMLHTDNCNFSFSGLKTAVLYLTKSLGDITDEQKTHIAQEFEDAVGDVLWKKARRALEQTQAQTLVISGGVAANTHVRRVFTEQTARYPGIMLRLPPPSLNTDNAIMIAMAGYYRALGKEFADPAALKANGNLRLA